MGTLNAVEQFFYDNAGYSYDPTTETPEQGRERGAVLIASAECWARETAYSFNWGIDPDGDSSDWIDDDEDGGKNREPWRVWECFMYDEKGNIAQSLHGIDFGRYGKPWGDVYKRVVEAELALEEWNSVVKV